MDLLRDSSFGYVTRILTGNKLLPYPIERHEEIIDNGATRIGDEPVIIVDWNGSSDPENPQNWRPSKQYAIGLFMCLYTFAVYVGSSIYTPGEEDVEGEFAVGTAASSLGLALYVLAYGVGTLVFSPLSEVPVIGRTTIYVLTYAIFVILSVPTSLVENFAGFLVLRFLLGFFGSPCLATSGATFQDVFPGPKVPYIVALWSLVTTCGPAFGPLLASYSVPVKGWRWSQWEILWLSGPIFLVMFMVMPETSAATILLRRARRLRAATRDERFKSKSEIDQERMSAKDVAFNALIKPWEINISDPAVLYTTFFTGLIYGIIYTWFEVFPFWQRIYGFSSQAMGLVFLSVFVGMIVSVPLYLVHFKIFVEKRISKLNVVPPEEWLTPGLWSSWPLPAGLFIFAFTSRVEVHWIVSLIGAALATGGAFFAMQSMFLYVPSTYPKYAASLLAANALARSVFAVAAILYTPPMFDAMGVAGGVSLLAGLTIACCGGLWFLYFFGKNLRARSRFAVK